LIYLPPIKPDITFTVGVLSMFMHQPREIHLMAALRILAYVKSSPRKSLLYKKHGHVFAFLTILTQAMLVIREIESLLLAITYLEEIL